MSPANISNKDSKGKDNFSIVSANFSKEIITNNISPYNGPLINHFVCGCKPTIIVADD